jgi:hypothetical protein
MSGKIQKILDARKTKPQIVVVEPDCQPEALRDFADLFDEGYTPFVTPKPGESGTALVIAALDMSAPANIANQVRPADFFEAVVERSNETFGLGAAKIAESLPLLTANGVGDEGRRLLQSGVHETVPASIFLSRAGNSQQLYLPGLSGIALDKVRRSALLAALFAARFWELSNALVAAKQSDGSPALEPHQMETVHALFNETIENL